MLPQFQYVENGQALEKLFNMMQSVWSTPLNALLARPANNSLLLVDIDLASGDNTIPHTLNRKLQGWIVVRQNASATFYDKQDTNSRQDVNLILNASAAVRVTLEVF